MARLGLEEFGWDALEKLEARKSHLPHRMRSASSVGPVFAWCCDFFRSVEYTTVLEAPMCNGGCRSDEC